MRGNSEMNKNIRNSIIIILIIAIIIVCIHIISNRNAENDEVNNIQEYVFCNNNNKIKIDDEFSREKYGQEKEYSEIISCAYEGLDRIYKYENYEITTYERDGKERIQSIYLLNDMVKTEEDVKITDSYNKMIEKYSDNYVREENMYTHIQGKTALKFIIENNIITSIEYSLK